MANTFAPQGFLPVRRIDGASWTAGQRTYKIASTDTNKYYRGDVIIMNGTTGYINPGNPSATTPVQGIFQGCEYLSTAKGYVTWSDTFQGGDTTQDVTAFVIDDQNTIFEAQVGTTGAAGGPATQASVQNNINYQLGTGNTSTGLSGAYLDYTTIATTTTLPFRVVDLVTFPPGANGTDITTAGNNVEVIFNNQAYKQLTGL